MQAAVSLLPACFDPLTLTDNRIGNKTYHATNKYKRNDYRVRNRVNNWILFIECSRDFTQLHDATGCLWISDITDGPIIKMREIIIEDISSFAQFLHRFREGGWGSNSNMITAGKYTWRRNLNTTGNEMMRENCPNNNPQLGDLGMGRTLFPGDSYSL